MLVGLLGLVRKIILVLLVIWVRIVFIFVVRFCFGVIMGVVFVV